MALYRVQGNGKAPAGLQAGDEVVTGGGTYRILGVNADGSYRSSLSNKYQTIYNYRGSYGTAPAGQTDTAQVRTPSYTPSGAASEAKAALDRVLSEKPGSYTSRWDSELDALYDQITNRKAFSYDLGADPMYRQYREQYQSGGTAGDGKHDGRGGRLSRAATAQATASRRGSRRTTRICRSSTRSCRSFMRRRAVSMTARARRFPSAMRASAAVKRATMTATATRCRIITRHCPDARGAYQSEAQRSENLALQYAKLANDNYWNELNYRSDREDAANAQYWKQLAYADKQAAAAEKAAQARQKAAQAGTAKDKQTKRSSSLARGRGEKRGRTAPGTARRDEIN